MYTIGMIKVPYTHDSELLKRFQKIEKKHGMNVEFVEQSGYSLQNLLEKADPFAKDTCGREDCFPCRQEGGGKCQVTTAVRYE